MIILEGPDNAGKSTLLTDLLALDPSLRVLKRQRFKPEMGETIGTSYMEALMPPEDGNRRAHANSVVDRFYASECIYGSLYRGGCRMTAREHYLIKIMLISYGAFVVYCNPGKEVILENWTAREQLYDGAVKIAEAYEQRLRRIFYPIPVIDYDWRSPSAFLDRRAIIARHHTSLSQFDLQLGWPVARCDSPF